MTQTGRTSVTTLRASCAECGRTYDARTAAGGSVQRFCSAPCRLVAWQKRQRQEPHTCPRCGTEQA